MGGGGEPALTKEHTDGMTPRYLEGKIIPLLCQGTHMYTFRTPKISDFSDDIGANGISVSGVEKVSLYKPEDFSGLLVCKITLWEMCKMFL